MMLNIFRHGFKHLAGNFYYLNHKFCLNDETPWFKQFVYCILIICKFGHMFYYFEFDEDKNAIAVTFFKIRKLSNPKRVFTFLYDLNKYPESEMQKVCDIIVFDLYQNCSYPILINENCLSFN